MLTPEAKTVIRKVLRTNIYFSTDAIADAAIDATEFSDDEATVLNKTATIPGANEQQVFQRQSQKVQGVFGAMRARLAIKADAEADVK